MKSHPENIKISRLEKKLVNTAEKLQAREEELTIINKVQKSLAAKMNMQAIYDLVGDEIRKIFDSQVVAICTFDHKKKIENFNYAMEKGKRFYHEPRPLNKLRKELIKKRKTILINNLTKEIQKKYGLKVLPGTESPKSLLFVPLTIGTKVNGYISLQNIDRKNAFSKSDVQLLSTLAHSMSTALENVRLFDETNRLFETERQRTSELAIINSVGEAMSRRLDVETVTKIVGDKIKDIFKAEAAEILLLDEKTNTIHVPYSYYKGYQNVESFALGEGMTSRIISSRKPFTAGTLDEQNSFGAISDETLGEADLTESYMGVPIIAGEKVLGVVSVQSYKKNAFNENNVHLLSTLSTNMGVVIENARLFDNTVKLLTETQQRNAELAVINKVQEGLVAKMDIQAIYDLVGEEIREIFDAQVVSIGSYDYTNQICSFKYDIEKGKRFYEEPRRFTNIDNFLIENQKMILINNNMIKGLESLGEQPNPVPGTEMPKSAVWVPLIVGKVVKGHVSLQNIDKENAFSDSDVRLLTTLANSMSVALENARLFDETTRLLEATKQQAAELAIINTVGEGLAQKLDYQAIIDLVGEKIREIFDAQIVTISPYNKKENKVHHLYVFEDHKRFYYDKPSEIDIDRKEIIETKKPLVFGTSEEIINHSGEGVLAGDMPKSFMGVPIILNQESTGVITVQDLNKEHLYKESDVRLLMTLASNMGVALENARLFEETNRLLDETKQRNAELAIINSVGEAMAKQLDLKTVTRIVGDKVKDIFHAEATEILLLDRNTSIINIPYSYYNGYHDVEPFSLGEGLTSHIIQTRQPLIFGSITEQDKFGAIYDEIDKTESYMGVPIIVGEKVLGVVSVQSFKKNTFDERSVQLLSTLSTNMGVALENARLFEETTHLLNETEQRNAELGVINSVQEGLVAKMNIQAIYDLVGNKIHDIFDTQVVMITSFNHDEKTEQFNFLIEKGQRFYPESRSLDNLRNHLINARQTILINENYEKAAAEFGLKVISGTDAPKSLLFVPLIVSSHVNGYISLQNIDRENAFSDSDVRLLTTLANSMSVAIENARLFNETQQRNAELSILNAIQRGLVMEMNFEGIIELVGDKLREAMNFQDIGIRLYDKEKDLVSYPYEFEHGERLFLESMKPTVMSRYVLENRKMLLLKKNNDEEMRKLGVEGIFTIPGTDRSKSVIAVPILVGNEARGLIIIENYEKEDAFSESDIRLLTTLANSMSVALENARLFNETVRLLEESKQRAAELSTVNSISKAIAAHLELDKLINLVGERARELFKANLAYVALYDKEKSVINFPYGYGDDFPSIPLGIGIVSRVIKTGEPLLLNKELDEKTAQLGIERSGIHSSSYLGVPIPVGDEIIGVISVQSTEQENRFSEEDLRLLNTIAANVGVAINNAEAYRQLNLTVDQLNSTLKDLKSTQQQLIVSEKLASLGQLTAGIAHEIKNPLNFVNNFAEVSIELIGELKTDLDTVKTVLEPDKSKNIEEILKDLEENAQRINQHGKRADSIVRSMLQHSRGKAGERQDSDMNAILEEDINLAYHGMRARDTSFNITIEKDFDESLEKVLVVPQDVSRVFLNIINNAFYEANKKKKIIKDNFSPTIKVSTKNFTDKIEVRIRDNGNGIPLEAQDKLFNPFFTTKPTGEGTGLGLSLSHDIIVKQHNGEIKFETESGNFTEFIITLPKNGN